MNRVLHLDDQTIAALLDPASVTDAVGEAFIAWGRGVAATTQRSRCSTGGLMSSAMAAVVPPFAGGKLYTTTDGEFTFVIVLFDAEGRLLCTLDGDVITAMRTPAASALAVRALAASDVTTAALIGSGRQAWAHLTMLVDELPRLERLAVWARSPGSLTELVERARAIGAPAVAACTPAAAVEGADVVVTVTSSSEPLFPASAIGDRMLLCAVGATKTDRREIDAETVGRCASVVCDDVVGSRSESGDLIHAAARGAFDWNRAIELHDVLAGNVDVSRAGDAPVLFETQGVAIQDVAVAGLAYSRHTAATHHPPAGAPPATSIPKEGTR